MYIEREGEREKLVEHTHNILMEHSTSIELVYIHIHIYIYRHIIEINRAYIK